MADAYIAIGNTVNKKYHDFGDGTYGEAVHVGSMADALVAPVGTTADAPEAATQTTSASTVISLLKGLYNLLESGLPFEVSPFGQRITRKTLTFDEDTGTVNLFTVTGLVVTGPVIFACGTSLVGGATMSVGVSDVVGLFGSVADTTAFDAGMYWDPGAGALATYPVGAVVYQFVLNGNDIIATITDGTVTSGELTFYCLWTPLSTDGNVVAA